MKEVFTLIDEVQRSGSSKSASIKKFQSLLKKNETIEETYLTAFYSCLDRVLLCSKTDAKLERLVAFFSESISTFVGRNLEIAVDYLIERSMATDKTVRFRACNLVSSILSLKSANQGEISDEVCNQITVGFLPRLNDRHVNTRVQAVYTLKNLQTPADDDIVTTEFIRLVNSDSSHEVRCAVVESIIINNTTLQILVNKIKDIHRSVRMATLKKLAENVDIRHLTITMRAIILRYGLNDRELLVKQAAVDLVFSWLKTFDYKVPQMLKYLGMTQHEKEIEEMSYHILDNLETRENIPMEIRKRIKIQSIDWNGPIETISSSDLIWTKLRCLYAHRYMKTTESSIYIAELVPDIIEVCRILENIPISSLYINNNMMISFRSLLQMSIYYDPSDTIGNQNLVQYCEDLVMNIELPDILIESVLFTWKLGLENLNEYDPLSIGRLIEKVLSYSVHDKATTTTTTTASISDEKTKNNNDEDDDNDDDDNSVFMDTTKAQTQTQHDTTLKDQEEYMIRALQLLSWSIQSNIGHKKDTHSVSLQPTRTTLSAEEGMTPPAEKNDKDDLYWLYEGYLPFVLECLQCLNPAVRGLAINCLGLYPLYSIALCDYYHIILQAASAELEDSYIRCQALQSILDISMIYNDKYKNDLTLSNLLVRIISSNHGTLQRIAIEGTSKLIFAGCLNDPRLFASLLKYFFIPQLITDQSKNANDEGEYNDGNTGINSLNHHSVPMAIQQSIEVGSSARLNQILSLFFHYFMINEHTNQEMLLSSISELMSDISALVRDQVLQMSTYIQVYGQVLSIIDKMIAIKKDSSSTTTSTLQSQSTEDSAAQTDVLSREQNDYDDNIAIQFHMRISASLCRELLKLGNSTYEKSLAKEYLKLFTNQLLSVWVRSDSGEVILRTLEMMIQSCAINDKVSVKNMKMIQDICNHAQKLSPLILKVSFQEMASGLIDLLGMNDDPETSFIFHTSSPINGSGGAYSVGTPMRRTYTQQKQKQYDHDDDYDAIEEEDDDENNNNEDDDEDVYGRNTIPVLTSSTTKTTTTATTTTTKAMSSRPERRTRPIIPVVDTVSDSDEEDDIEEDDGDEDIEDIDSDNSKSDNDSDSDADSDIIPHLPVKKKNRIVNHSDKNKRKYRM